MEFQSTELMPSTMVPQDQKPRLSTVVVAPLLSEFLDFRKYLESYYQYRRALSKQDVRPYNYAVFSAAANIRSPNYLKMIIEGKRNLSEDMVGKFGKALGLVREQVEEFRLLVLLGQAPDPGERTYWLKQLNEFRVRQQLKSGQIDQKVWEKIPNWIAWVLYAMMDQEGVDFQPEKLRTLLRGKASAQEIHEALKALIESGQVVQDDVTGKLVKGGSGAEAPDEIPVALVRKLQSQLMYLGLESLFEDAPTEREFGTLTVALTKSEFEEIKFKLRQFRKQIHKDNAIHRRTSRGERVYQLNLQLFPVTDAKKS